MAASTEDVVFLLVALVGLALVVVAVLVLVSISPTAHREDAGGEDVRAGDGGDRAQGLRRRVRAEAGAEVEEAHAVAGMSRRQLHKEAKRRAREEQRKFEEAERKARQDRVDRKAAARQAAEDERELAELERLQKLQDEATAEEVVEDYDQWKSVFEMKQAGHEIDDDQNHQAQKSVEELVNYIKEHRIVVIEDLAAAFQMTASNAIDRIRDLEAMGNITGVMDERGKYVYVSEQEMDEIAQLLCRRGRISVSELTHETNKLLYRS